MTKLKSKGKKESSNKWLRRQINDPYVKLAQKEGYRSRAVYKLIEINDKYKFLTPNAVIVDLGAAPGSWMEVASKKVTNGKIIGVDLKEIEPIENTEFIVGDFLDDDVLEKINKMLDGKGVDVVLSDMAANSCGHPNTDHLRIMTLCEAALDFAITVLNKNGTFLAKVLIGGTENNLLNEMKKHFKHVKHVKPKASRKDSSEMYVIATGFKR